MHPHVFLSLFILSFFFFFFFVQNLLSCKLTDLDWPAGQRSVYVQPINYLWWDGANGHIGKVTRINLLTHPADFVHMWCTKQPAGGHKSVRPKKKDFFWFLFCCFLEGRDRERVERESSSSTKCLLFFLLVIPFPDLEDPAAIMSRRRNPKARELETRVLEERERERIGGDM